MTGVIFKIDSCKNYKQEINRINNITLTSKRKNHYFIHRMDMFPASEFHLAVYAADVMPLSDRGK